MAAIPAIRTTIAVPRPLPVTSRSRVQTHAAAFAACAAVAYVCYCAASLAAGVLTEQARRDGIEAVARASAARSAETLLERRLDGLKSIASIDRWAAENGFYAPDRALSTSLSQGR